MSKALSCHPNPCTTCPYRRDTPPGVWARDEYEKLPTYDDPMAFAGTFLCHADQSAVCRGWLEVHEQNLSVRLAMFNIKWTDVNRKPTKVPLYRSGRDAMRAGLRGVSRPSAAAKRPAAPAARGEAAMNTWTANDGREIPIRQLSDDHLLNILRMLVRNACAKKIKLELAYIRAPIHRMGDAAQDAFLRELDDVMDTEIESFLHESWPSLSAEARRRSLPVPKMPGEDLICAALVRVLFP